MTPKKLPEDPGLREAIRAVQEKKGWDLVVLDLRPVTNFFDFFLIASGHTAEHLRAMADRLQEALKELGLPLHHVEGYDHGTWILMDFEYLIVHLFRPETRSYYSLETLWGDVPSWKLPDEPDHPTDA